MAIPPVAVTAINEPLQAVRQELPLHEPKELWRRFERYVPQEPLQAVCQELPLHEPKELWRRFERYVPQERV